MEQVSNLELNYDERKSARKMSSLFQTQHYESVLKPGDMERIIPKLSWHLEEPRIGQSYPNFHIANYASKFVKVVLSGTGGDELFGGYPWRYYRAAKNTSYDDYISKYYDFWQRLTNKRERFSIFAPIQNETKHIDPKSIFRSVFPSNIENFSSIIKKLNFNDKNAKNYWINKLLDNNVLLTVKFNVASESHPVTTLVSVAV